MSQRKHLHSIHVDHNKHTPNCATEVMPIPDFVRISMSQHIGAPCTPVVKKGDYVKVGQLLGDSDAFVSAPIYSGVSGTVTGIETDRSGNGGSEKVVVIETDKKQEISESIAVPSPKDHKEFVEQVRRSGAVGLGGAAFPTHVKFAPSNLDEVDTLIINGAECEPFITSDHRTMLEDTQDVIDGLVLTAKFLGVKKTYIGIENNKPDAIEKFRTMLSEQKIDNVEVVELRSRYPQGAERVMIYEVTGRVMDAGVLPAQLGVILSNVTTTAFLGQFFRTGMPLINKRITVDGSAVATPKNVLVPIGTKISDVIEFCGGYKEEPKKLIMGGPMMGRAIYSDQMSIVKNNNAILAFGEKEAFLPQETACINRGRGHFACPFELMPTEYYDAYKRRDAKKLEELKVNQCMECGSCSYVCPARRPLSFVNKLSKAYLKEVADSGK